MTQKLVKCMEHPEAEFCNEWNASFLAKTKQNKTKQNKKQKLVP